jgi:hypothetical protein
MTLFKVLLHLTLTILTGGLWLVGLVIWYMVARRRTA